MSELTAAEIKSIRAKYGLSQQYFAVLLGIGEASMVRYEKGQTPTRANENLIRAAEDAVFMLGCLERNGDRLPQGKRSDVERIAYALVNFSEGEAAEKAEKPAPSMDEAYFFTLQQEILNEQAAEMLGDLFRFYWAAVDAGDMCSAEMLDEISKEIALVKFDITSSGTDSLEAIAELRGRMRGLMDFARAIGAKVLQ